MGPVTRAHPAEIPPSPLESTTVGLPSPRQSRWSRWPPTSYSLPGAAVPSVEDVAPVVVLLNTDVVLRDVAWSLLEVGPVAEAAAVLWGSVVRQTHPEWSAPVLGLYGWASWVAGDGASVNVAIEAMDRWAPEYSWAALLAEMVDKAVSPKMWPWFVEPMRLALAKESGDYAAH